MPEQPALDTALGDDALLEALAEARALGFLGPGPVEDHVRHAVRFAGALGDRLRGPALDLGAGGGVPGLVLARLDPETRWTFLDSNQRRTTFLRQAAGRLALGAAQVVLGRAEAVARDPGYRARFSLVTARSFGPPAVTAECGAPLLAVGGHLAVSDPPGGDPGRWPSAGLARLGLTAVLRDDPGIFVARLETEVEDRYPRRTGIPAKRPLF